MRIKAAYVLALVRQMRDAVQRADALSMAVDTDESADPVEDMRMFDLAMIDADAAKEALYALLDVQPAAPPTEGE